MSPVSGLAQVLLNQGMTRNTTPNQTAVPAQKEIWLLLDSRGMGGIESHVAALAEALCRSGHPACVVFLEDHGAHPLDARLDECGIPRRVLRGGFAGLRVALRERPMLVHTHGYKAGLLGRLACRLAGVPVVSTFHSGDPGRGRVRLYDALDRWSAPLAPAIAVSEEIAARVRGGAERVDNFVTLPAQAVGPHAGRVAFVGRFAKEKGPHHFCTVAAAIGDGQFDLFGDGPLWDELEPTFGDIAAFHGAVDDMPQRWPEIGLLCMTSRHEGLPMAALEALAHGIPVAAFAVGGLPDLIEHGRNGWLVPPGDTAAMTATVAQWRLLPESTRQEIAAAARSTVASRYTPEAQLEHVLAVYERANPTGDTAKACRRDLRGVRLDGSRPDRDLDDRAPSIQPLEAGTPRA